MPTVGRPHHVLIVFEHAENRHSVEPREAGDELDEARPDLGPIRFSGRS